MFTTFAISVLWSVQAASAATWITSTTIAQNTHWTISGSPYVVSPPYGDVTVTNGVTLTIDPGVVVKFATTPLGEGRGLVFSPGATLIAQGTVGQPIVFTGIRDDSVGGDTAGDGPTVCAKGQWKSIKVQGPTASVISNAVVRCGSTSATPTVKGALEVVGVGSSLSVTDTDISKGNNAGIYASAGTLIAERVTIGETWGGVIVVGGASARVSYSTISGLVNGNGIRVEDSTLSADHNTITANWIGATVLLSATTSATASTFYDNTIARNTRSGVYIGSMGTGGMPPLERWPYGHRNNIFGNDSAHWLNRPLAHDLNVPAGGPVDWSNNYWGEPASYWPEPTGVKLKTNRSECQLLFVFGLPWPGTYLAYAWTTDQIPASPSNTQTVITYGIDENTKKPRPEPIYCTRTYAYLGEPDDWSSVPFGSG